MATKTKRVFTRSIPNLETIKNTVKQRKGVYNIIRTNGDVEVWVVSDETGYTLTETYKAITPKAAREFLRKHGIKK